MPEWVAWIVFTVAMVIGLGPTLACAVHQLREMQRIIDRRSRRQ